MRICARTHTCTHTHIHTHTHTHSQTHTLKTHTCTHMCTYTALGQWMCRSMHTPKAYSCMHTNPPKAYPCTHTSKAYACMHAHTHAHTPKAYACLYTHIHAYTHADAETQLHRIWCRPPPHTHTHTCLYTRMPALVCMHKHISTVYGVDPYTCTTKPPMHTCVQAQTQLCMTWYNTGPV